MNKGFTKGGPDVVKIYLVPGTHQLMLRVECGHTVADCEVLLISDGGVINAPNNGLVRMEITKNALFILDRIRDFDTGINRLKLN